MKLRTLFAMMGGGDAPVYLRALRLMTPVHRVAWLAAASKHGILDLLRIGPRDLGELAESLGVGSEGLATLEAWLRHGCLLKEIEDCGGRYRLRGQLARHMADPRHPELAALAETLVSLHVPGVFGALDHLREGRDRKDLDAKLVARVAELTAPVMREVIDRFVPATGPARLLELGCGSARHLRHACARNPGLTATGIELDEAVLKASRRAVGRAKLTDRVRIVQGDVRELALGERFDVVTMFNLIYYFPAAARASVIANAAAHVDEGGVLLIVNSCRGGTLSNNLMDLWFSSMRDAGPLPEPPAVVGQIEEAGLVPAPPERMLPAEEYYLFVGRRLAAAG